MVNRWGNNGNSDRLYLGSKTTADGNFSHKINRCLLLGRKDMINLDSILKSRNITLPTKGGSDSKASACNAGDMGLTPGSGRSPGEGNGSPLQYSDLENPMDRGAW